MIFLTLMRGVEQSDDKLIADSDYKLKKTCIYLTVPSTFYYFKVSEPKGAIINNIYPMEIRQRLCRTGTTVLECVTLYEQSRNIFNLNGKYLTL